MLKNNVFLVGGAVRDILLGLEPKDKDYVVVGKSEQEMLDLGFEKVGKDFPVFLHPENGFEYALARKERKNGNGYNGFSVEVENVSLHDDLFRRDLTINAMAMDEDNNIIDPYGGQKDLQERTLRHVSHHFSEDPVRILRIARFSARYNFSISPDTILLMKEMVKNGEFDFLTPERVWKEFDKTLEEPYLNNFFNTLEEIGALKKLPGFSEISEKNFLNDNFLRNFLHTFSQIDEKDLSSWKLPSSLLTQLNHYKEWKSNQNFYHYLSTEEKLSFITKTKSIHNSKEGEEILFHIVHYNSWKNETEPNLSLHLDNFLNDIKKLKEIDYLSISEECKKDKLNIKNTIVQHQLAKLNLNSKKAKP